MSGYHNRSRRGQGGGHHGRDRDGSPRNRSRSPGQRNWQPFRQRDENNAQNPNDIPVRERGARGRLACGNDERDYGYDQRRDTSEIRHNDGRHSHHAHHRDSYRPDDHRLARDEDRGEQPREHRASNYHDQEQYYRHEPRSELRDEYVPPYRHEEPQVRRDAYEQTYPNQTNQTRYGDAQLIPGRRESYTDRRRYEDEMASRRRPRFDEQQYNVAQRGGYGAGHRGHSQGQKPPSRHHDGYAPRRATGGRPYARGSTSRDDSRYGNPSGRDEKPEEEIDTSNRKTLNVKDGERYSLKLNPLVIRGTAGKSIQVQVNHFEITELPQAKVHQYTVLFSVPKSSQRASKRPGDRKISTAQIEEAVAKVGDGFLGQYLALNADFTQGWTTEEIPESSAGKSTVVDLNGHTAERPRQVQIDIRKTGSLDLNKFIDYLRSRETFGPEVENWFKALNAIFRDDPAYRWMSTQNSSNFFNRSVEGNRVTDIIEAVHGIHQAIRYTFGRLTLNVDVVCGSFYKSDMNLLEVLRTFLGVGLQQELRELSNSKDHRFMDICGRLVGMPFRVKHLRSSRNARVMKVRGIDFDDALHSKFNQSQDGVEPRMISVYDYYLERYSIKLEYEFLPLLVTSDGSFPIELCYTAGDKYKEHLTSHERREFVQIATGPADKRAEAIMRNVRGLDWSKARYPRAIGLRVSAQMLQLQARILPTPTPLYNSDTGPGNVQKDGSWNLRRVKFRKSMKFDAWGVMLLPSPRDSAIQNSQMREDVVKFFQGCLQPGFSNVGMRCPPGDLDITIGTAQGNIKRQIREMHAAIGNLYQSAPKILCFVVYKDLPSYIYTAIKSCCEMELGVASQVMQHEKLRAAGLQYAGNIAMKVNVKLGGVNSKVRVPLFDRARVMIIGGDTTHPSPAECQRQPPPHSFCALTASHDRDCVDFTAIASAQGPSIELIQDFKPMCQELLKRYLEKNNGRYPESIIYFRDGVSETQYAALRAKEENELLEVCNETGMKIKVTLIICTKRHHTRIFPINPSEESQCDRKNKNVYPGTVVEASEDQDIFLVSHGAIQGTVRPTRYTILLDQNQLGAVEFQMLVMSSCYSYGRATRGVSLTPAVYYADTIAERAKTQYSSPNNADGLIRVHEKLTYTMFWQ